MVLTKTEIDTIKPNLSGIIEDSMEEVDGKVKDGIKEILVKKRLKTGIDKITLADVFLSAIGYLSNYSSMIEEEETRKKIEDFISDNENMIEELSDLFEERGNGKIPDVSYYADRKISEIVRSNKNQMSQIVLLFYMLFIEEEK